MWNSNCTAGEFCFGLVKQQRKDDFSTDVRAALQCHCQRQDEVISKAFSGRQGRAYLFHSTINTRVGTSEDRQLLTGWHTVADVQCVGCKTVLGWTYLKAWEPSQKYKEGE